MKPAAARVGLVGLGRMGAAILPRLIAAGLDVVVWNRSPEKTTEAARLGARVASSLAEVVAGADIVLSSLFDDASLQEVYLGASGLLSTQCVGRLFVDMSTVSPETVRQIARRAEAISAAFVDAPLSGSVGPAKEGKLLILAGGRAEDVERARPVLSVFSRRLEHVGLVGAGAAMKIAIQLPISVYWQAIAESLSIGRRLGLDVGQMLELIADSPAALAMLGGKIPTILEQERGVAFDLASARKDLSVMSRTADSLQVPAPVVDAALMRYAAAVEGGWGARDIACIATFSLQADPQDRDAPA